MKILLIHQAFVLPQESGGTRHYELACHLIAMGHQATIVASNMSYLAGKKNSQLDNADEKDGLIIKRAYTLPGMHKNFVRRVLSYLSFMVSSVFKGLASGASDIVIGTSPPIFQAASAWLVSVIRRCPFVLEIRDLWPAFAVDMGVLRNPLLIKLAKGLEKFLYKRADKIIVNSPAYETYLLQQGIGPEKIAVIPNGVDTGQFEAAVNATAIREQYQLKDKQVVTYAGALGMANDIPTLLQAAKQLQHRKNIHFLLAGDGKERVRLEAMAKQLQLENVTFTGPLPKASMPDVLAASDVCVAILQDIPMFAMPYPNKVFDYMAAAKPVVPVINGAIREVVERAEAGVYSPPGDADALARTLEDMLSDPQALQEMGERGRAYVKAHFERSQQAKQFADVLSNVQKDITNRCHARKWGW